MATQRHNTPGLPGETPLNRQAASPASEIEAEFTQVLRSMTRAQFGRFLDMIEEDVRNAQA